MRDSDAPGWSSALCATEAAKALRDGAYLPSEYVRDVLASAVSRNPEHRAFVEIYADQALRDADVSDRRLVRGAGRPLALTEDFDRILKDVDALVTVTTLRPQGPAFDADTSDDTSSPLSPRMPLNVVGAPAIAVPISLTANGLPLSMQLVGARGADYQLLALDHACEQALDGRVQRLTARRS
jgi:Asp-tRNA(Asn)/Glu-tRNA(Gln) amidotransferase A subunit family amidase